MATAIRPHAVPVFIAIILVPWRAHAQDVAAGKDVFGPCAACHGSNGEGGKNGEYPRLAGLSAGYLIKQLQDFQERKRNNLPMFPYTEPRELSPADMADVAAYLSRIELPSKMPVLPETASALERLEATQRVLVVPRVEGDISAGAALFRQQCIMCHGRSGEGRKDKPPLVGQWPTYLARQAEKIRTGERPHKTKLPPPQPQEFSNILAWLTSIQSDERPDKPLAPEPP